MRITIRVTTKLQVTHPTAPKKIVKSRRHFLSYSVHRLTHEVRNITSLAEAMNHLGLHGKTCRNRAFIVDSHELWIVLPRGNDELLQRLS